LTFRSLDEGGGGSDFFPKASTLTERRYKPFKIQNPTFKIPLLPRPLAVQISSQRHRRSQSDATSHSKSKIQHSKSLFFRASAVQILPGNLASELLL
jgi:hypothetical protein